MSHSLAPRVSFGIDIGGSLAKIALFRPTGDVSTRSRHDMNKISYAMSSTQYGTSGIRDVRLEAKLANGTLHFIHFQTHKYMEFIAIMEEQQLLAANECVFGTGGGIHKFNDILTEKLNIRIRHDDELKCLLRGLNFMLTNTENECYFMEDQESKQPSDHMPISIGQKNEIFPYILVNVGSGASVLKIEGPTQFERVSGSQIGGGTFWGLSKLYIDGNISYKEAFDLTKTGDTNNVNMLVSDIYGGDYSLFGLGGDIVASAFGKLGAMNQGKIASLRKEDVARGLLDLIAMNIAQIGYLNAIRFGFDKVIFAGNFLRQNELSKAILSWAIHYWSKGTMKAYFLRHEGYFGALGALLVQHPFVVTDNIQSRL